MRRSHTRLYFANLRFFLGIRRKCEILFSHVNRERVYKIIWFPLRISCPEVDSVRARVV